MIIDLVPDFLALRAAPDPVDAYLGYLERHRALLGSYWHNYVLDLDTPAARDVITAAVQAGRADLERLLAAVDVPRLAAEALDAAGEALAADLPLDCVIMVGVGAANAGELVIDGRGLLFVCLEHFTGHANPETFGLGLPPSQLPLWIAHEAAHVVRYCSPTSRTTLRELLLNEGVAVHASRAAAPGLADETYLGVSRRHYRRLREQDAFLVRAARDDLDRAGLGLRLRWLTGGLTPAARIVLGRVLPERSGYYLGERLAEALVAEQGLAAAVRAPAAEFNAAEARRQSERAAGA